MDELSNRGSRVARGKAARTAVPDAIPTKSSDEKKSRQQLLDEIADLRQRLNAKDALDPGQKASESELKGTRQRLQHLLAVSPAIIYTTKASGDFTCTFVSENLRAIMGYSPEEMTTDPKCWPGRLHPEDAPRVFEEMRPLIEHGGGTVDYRFRHRDGHYIWIQDTFRVVNDEAGRPGAGRRLGGHHRAQVHRNGIERHAAAPAIPARGQSRDHLHDQASGDYALHLRQREISARSWAIRRRR